MKPVHPVEAAILCAVALAWAVATIARTLLLAAVSLLLLVARHRRCGRLAPQPAPVTAQPVLPPVTLATIAEELQSLPGARLRAITGNRRKVAKRAIVEAWLAMPI